MTIKQLQKLVHKIAKLKGFWSEECSECKGMLFGKSPMAKRRRLGICKCKGTGQIPINRNNGELIALIHEELSEALRAFRKDNPKSDKIPKFSSVEEELGDCIIRILDTAEARGYDIEGAIEAKIKYNKTRKYRHGKKF